MTDKNEVKARVAYAALLKVENDLKNAGYTEADEAYVCIRKAVTTLHGDITSNAPSGETEEQRAVRLMPYGFTARTHKGFAQICTTPGWAEGQYSVSPRVNGQTTWHKTAEQAARALFSL